MRCVRPDLTMSLNASALSAKAFSSRSSAGSSEFVASSSAARCTALGNTSLDDWPMLTWSFGWAPSPASAAITSLAFMFDDVPDPVWKTSIGNWPSCRPCAISSAAAAMRCARSPSSRPSSAFARAAAPLMRPSQRTTATGTRSPDTGKFATALRVSPPHSSSVVSRVMPTTLALRRLRRSASGRRGDLRARAGLGRHGVGMERLAAVVADEHRVDELAARVAKDDRRAGLVGQVLVAPLHDRDDGRVEVPPGLRQPVLEALGLLLVEAALEDPRPHEVLEPRREDVARDAEVALDVREAPHPVEGLAHDQHRPALAEDLHRPADRADGRAFQLVHGLRR